MATLFAYALWSKLLTEYPANRVTPFSLLVPFIGLNVGWLWFGEKLQPMHLFGGAVLMASFVVILFGNRWFMRLPNSTAEIAMPEHDGPNQ